MPASQSPEIPDYRARFLSILNNPAKTNSPSGGVPLRKRGFVVIVRGGVSLKPLQTLCFEQTYNRCLTIRHRLKPKAAVGTLLAACVADLNTIVKHHTGAEADELNEKFSGDVLPNPNEEVWERLGKQIAKQVLSRDRGPLFLDVEGSGNLSRTSLTDFFEFLNDESTLRVGQRLVLFGELSEPATDLAEWQTAMEMVFRQLPERVGLVISNVPKDFQVPSDDPHFLDIISADSADPQEPVEFSYKYTND